MSGRRIIDLRPYHVPAPPLPSGMRAGKNRVCVHVFRRPGARRSALRCRTPRGSAFPCQWTYRASRVVPPEKLQFPAGGLIALECDLGRQSRRRIPIVIPEMCEDWSSSITGDFGRQRQGREKTSRRGRKNHGDGVGLCSLKG